MFRLPLMAGTLFLGVFWAGYEWLLNTAQTKLNERLASRGLILESEGESWSLWGGMTLKDARLCHRTPDGKAQGSLLEISALHVDLLWRETWSSGGAVTHWQAEDAALTLKDDAGAVTFDHFFTDFFLRGSEIQVLRADATRGPLTVALRGRILTAETDRTPTPGDFRLDLRSLRSTLNTLRFNPDAGPFRITGDFTVDRRQEAEIWTGNLQGTGKDVEWRGLPLRDALVQGQVSQAGLDLTCDLVLLQGKARVKLDREGWSKTPLRMQGRLTDTAGREDAFTASYLGSARTLTVDQISGPADLIELARTFPPLAALIPNFLEDKTFPDLLAKDFVWVSGADPAEWSLKSLELRSPASLVLQVREHPLTVNALTGQVSQKNGLWQLNDVRGKLLEGSFTLDGNYDGRILSKARVSLRSLRLARLSPWIGRVSQELKSSDLTLDYSGAICRDPVRSTGSGTLILTEAPVVHIPILDQTYSLFPKILPDKGRDGTGEFQVGFAMTKGVARIDPFKARSESVTVTATGTVDLVRRRVDGHARANLRGVAGIVTSPLSHVLTDMDITGTLDDIRVSPDGPSSAVKGAAGAAKSGVKMSSQILKEGLTLPFEALGMFGRGRKSD